MEQELLVVNDLSHVLARSNLVKLQTVEYNWNNYIVLNLKLLIAAAGRRAIEG